MHPRETNQAKRKQTQYGGGHTCSSPAGPRPGRSAGKRLGHWPQGSFPRAKGGLGTPQQRARASEGAPQPRRGAPGQVSGHPRESDQDGSWGTGERSAGPTGSWARKRLSKVVESYSPTAQYPRAVVPVKPVKEANSRLPTTIRESKPSASRFVPCCFRGFMPELRTRPWPHSSLQEGGKPTGFLATAWQPLVP